jgi:hypothetical protein
VIRRDGRGAIIDEGPCAPGQMEAWSTGDVGGGHQGPIPGQLVLPLDDPETQRRTKAAEASRRYRDKRREEAHDASRS